MTFHPHPFKKVKKEKEGASGKDNLENIFQHPNIALNFSCHVALSQETPKAHNPNSLLRLERIKN